MRASRSVYYLIVLLPLLFTLHALSEYSEPLATAGLSPHTVVVGVYAVEGGVKSPVSGAEVGIGLLKGFTDENGRVSFKVFSGEYSSYVIPPDSSLRPLLTELTIEGPSEIEVVFVTGKAKPESVEVRTTVAWTSLQVEARVPEGIVAFVSDPVIGYLDSKAEPKRASPSEILASPYYMRVNDTKSVIVDVKLSGYVSAVDLSELYVPYEVIELNFYTLDS